MKSATHRPLLGLKHVLMACVIAAGSTASLVASSAEQGALIPSASTYRFLVGFGPGGIPDLAARIIADKLSDRQKTPAIVVNKMGVGGTLAANEVLTATPDGATVLSVSPAHATAPAIFREMRYDTLKDFAPVTLIGDGPAVLVVPNDLAVKTVADLVRQAKEKPGAMNYSSAGVGSSTHFAVELLRQHAGIELLHVPYKGVAEALTEVVAGRVEFTIAPYVAAAHLVKGGRVRALAVTGKSRMPDMPDVPTVAESGVPGYEWTFWYGLLVPSKTPPVTIDRLNHEVVEILNLPDVRAKLEQMGVSVAASSPAAFGELLEAEVAKFTKLAAAANIQPN